MTTATMHRSTKDDLSFPAMLGANSQLPVNSAATARDLPASIPTLEKEPDANNSSGEFKTMKTGQSVDAVLTLRALVSSKEAGVIIGKQGEKCCRNARKRKLQGRCLAGHPRRSRAGTECLWRDRVGCEGKMV